MIKLNNYCLINDGHIFYLVIMTSNECCFCNDIILNNSNFYLSFYCEQCDSSILSSAHDNCYYYYGRNYKKICNNCAS